MNDEIVTIAVSPYVGDQIGDWIADYQAVTQRVPTGDPESHEQHLMDLARLLGAASSIMRLMHDGTRRRVAIPAPYAVSNGQPPYGAQDEPVPGFYGDPAAGPGQPRFDPFAGQPGDQP